MELVHKKIMIVGDGNCGKTTLNRVCCDELFPDQPSVVSGFEILVDAEVDGKRVELALWETFSQECYSQLRTIYYEGSDIILMCFSIDDPNSLENILKEWNPEVRRYCPNAPTIVVGNKMDLRNEPDTISGLAKRKQKPVTSEEGRSVAEQINAHKYLECSAKTKEGVKEVFETAIKVALQ